MPSSKEKRKHYNFIQCREKGKSYEIESGECDVFDMTIWLFFHNKKVIYHTKTKITEIKKTMNILQYFNACLILGLLSIEQRYILKH